MLFPKLLEPCPSLPFRNTPGGKSNKCCFRQVLDLWCYSHKGGGGFGGVRVRERVWGLWEGQPRGPVNGKRLWLAGAGSVLREDEGQWDIICVRIDLLSPLVDSAHRGCLLLSAAPCHPLTFTAFGSCM